MKKNLINTILLIGISVLFIIGFFLPANIVKGFINTGVSIMDRSDGWVFLLIFIFLTAATGTLTYFKPRKNRYSSLIQLIIIYLFTILFFIDSVGRIEDSDFVSITMGFAPIYFLFIAILFSVFQFKNQWVLSFFDKFQSSQENVQITKETEGDSYDQLEKIKSLYDKGVLTEVEYNEEKNKILNKIK